MKSSVIRLLFLYATALFTSSSFAYELITEKSFVTSGCEGGVSCSIVESCFIDSLPELMGLYPGKTEFPFDRQTIDFLAYASGCSSSAVTRVYSKDGYANSNISLSSDHNFYLYNDSNKSCAFKVNIKLFTDDNCIKEEVQTYNLKQKEMVKNSITLFLNKYYQEPGSYKINASTEIFADSWLSSSSSDLAYVIIK